MTFSPKALWLVLVTAILVLAVSGCNDTLRQFITPVPAPGGDPGALSHAVVLSTNPAVPTNGGVALGSDLHIDVSGDTVAGIVNVGPQPLFIGKTTNRVIVLNSDNTATSYLGLLPQSSPVSTVTLPAGIDPRGGGFSSAGNFYIANTAGTNVSMISSAVNAVTTSVTVGSTPVAVAGNSANNKIYVVNQGSNDVTVVSTSDNFVIKNIPVGLSPVWGVMAPDGVHVFIVNQGDNTVSVIDTLLDQVIATILVGQSPNYAVFEPHNQRVYVSNTGSPVISVIKANGIDLANQILPTKIADIPIPSPAVSVAALPDGTRAYAALGGCPAGTNHINIITNLPNCPGGQVAVIDSQALALKNIINVGAGAVSIAAANNSARVYVVGANVKDSSTGANAANVSIINTATDSVLSTIPVPQQSLGCQNPNACPQNSTQIPFQVIILP
jgi:YVTN family beta-propeller protein